MDRQPTLQSERLLLRPLAADDWDALYAVARDPLIWEQHPMHDRWREDVFRSYFDEALREAGALVAIAREDGRMAGCSQYRPTPFDPAAIEIGWTFLARAHWGTGLNHDMKRLMLAHALAPEPDGVPRVLFRVGETNIRSRKAMEAVGGVLTDMVEEGEYRGRSARHVIYEITRDGFANGPLASSKSTRG